MAAAHGAGELVVPRARIFDAVQRGRRLPPHPEIRMPPAVEVGFMRPGRRAVPDDLGSATLVVSSYHAPDRCQSHGLPFLLRKSLPASSARPCDRSTSSFPAEFEVAAPTHKAVCAARRRIDYPIRT